MPVSTQFITWKPGPANEIRLIRSHVAKVTRARRIGAGTSAATSSSSSPQPEESNSSVVSRSLDSTPDVRFDPNRWSHDEHQAIDMLLTQGPGIPYALSPIFGASLSLCPEMTAEPELAHAALIVFDSYLTMAFSTEELAHWFTAFTQDTLLFNAFTYLRFFIQKRLTGALPVSQEQAMIRSSVNTLNTINDRLGDLSAENAESVLLSMAFMLGINASHEAVEPLLFVPHLLFEEGFDVGHVKQIDGFVPAVKAILDHIGGQQAINDQALYRLVCMFVANDPSPVNQKCLPQNRSDLVAASQRYSRPVLECGWSIDPSVFSILNALPARPGDPTPGVGFYASYFTNFPRLSALLVLSTIDCLMPCCRNQVLGKANFIQMTNARNAAKHAVLSMPPWSELAALEKGDFSFGNLYECCRLTAVLYSNAVIVAIAPDSAGIVYAVRDLRLCLELSNLGLAAEGDISGLILWMLFVGGIASYRGPHWDFFVTSLRTWTYQHSITSLEMAKSMLTAYVWSHSAGEQGAIVLWNAVISGH